MAETFRDKSHTKESERTLLIARNGGGECLRRDLFLALIIGFIPTPAELEILQPPFSFLQSNDPHSNISQHVFRR